MPVTLAEIAVPSEVMEIAAQSIRAYFEPICKVGGQSNAQDFLTLSKSYKRAARIEMSNKHAQ